MKILKRNQIIISVLALMLITVGYMSYTSNVQNAVETGKLMDAEKFAGIGDARLVSSNNTVESNVAENDKLSNDEKSNEIENASSISDDSANEITTSTTENSNEQGVVPNNSAQTTSAQTTGANYFAVSKLERDTMYSQMVESYQNIISNNAVSPDQKNISTQEISKINNKKNSIMIAENLIKNLGFQDVVIFVNDNSTSVIVKAEKLSEADVAQIQNIVCREIGVETENIHISVK